MLGSLCAMSNEYGAKPCTRLDDLSVCRRRRTLARTDWGAHRQSDEILGNCTEFDQTGIPGRVTTGLTERVPVLGHPERQAS